MSNTADYKTQRDELLAALETIAKIGREDYGPAAIARMYDAARAAIAKAKG